MAAGDAVIVGSQVMTLKTDTRSYSRRAGEQKTLVYEGPSSAAETMYALALPSPSYESVQLEIRDGLGIVSMVLAEGTIYYGTWKDDNSTWELVGRAVPRDLRSHPYFNQQGSTAYHPQMASIDRAIAAGEEPPSRDDVMQRYYGLRLSGVDVYPDVLAVIRQSFVTAKDGLISVAWAGTNRVVALSSINAPTTLLSNLSELTRLSRSVELSIPYTDAMFESGAWEFVKQLPSVVSVAGTNRYQIVYEWHGSEQVSAVLYGGTFDPKL